MFYREKSFLILIYFFGFCAFPSTHADDIKDTVKSHVEDNRYDLLFDLSNYRYDVWTPEIQEDFREVIQDEIDHGNPFAIIIFLQVLHKAKLTAYFPP